MSEVDADRLGVTSGQTVRLTTRAGSTEVTVEVTDAMRAGHISLPNGFGLEEHGSHTGVAPNTLTLTEDRDEWAGTPWHKHVSARVEALA